MTDDQHGDEYGDRHTGSAPAGGGRWDPLPQGDYDDGATAFVKLPEGGVDALLASSESPLAAPGHGYVPPQITVTPATTAGTDPAATGSWAVPSAPSAPVDGTQWQVPDAGQDPAAHQGYGDYAAQQDPYGGAAPYDVNAGQDDRFGYRPGATAQWDFSQASQAETEATGAGPAPGQDVTGQWSIPVADGDLPDESGEFTTSSLAEQWGTGAPATLPGGAPAPWATQPTGRPWGEGAAQPGPAEDRGTPSARPAGQPWGEGSVPTAPADEERPAGSAHGPGPGASGPGYGSAATGHEYGQRSDSGAGAGTDHETGSAVGANGPHPTAPVHGPGPGASGPGHGADAVGDEGPDSAAGPHRPHPTAPAYGPGPGVGGPGYGATATGDEHEREHRPDPGASADADHGPDPAVGAHGPHPTAPADTLGAAASGHGGESGASPDGSHPADGPYAHGPADAADSAVPVTDGPRGAEEAAEGPAGRSVGPAEEAGAGSRPEGADGPVTDPAPGAGREHVPEPAREHGQAPAAATRPESADGPRNAAAEVSGPAGHGTGPADAADARTVADGPETDAGAAEADPDPDGTPEPSAPAGPREEHPLASYVLRVNGADRPVTDAWIGESLLYVLRERLGLAGAKDGCSQGECGACNVQVDGRLVASCLVPSVTAAGSEVRTVEGLAADGQPSDVQRALARRGAVQCGFCVPGMAMTVHNLLEGNPAPTELEARQALCGNLCRCSGYRGVLEAVQEVVAEREAHADADAQAGADSEEPRIPHQAGPGAGGVNPAAFDSPPPHGAQDAPGPHDQPPYGDHGTHGRDGGHA
ncbi:2Fe-2S iron-sulfur cluster-binding protein [Streptomyces tendae]|uniref:2Fe-2S iron-sulfur cluster-binding protein n=1 Tax=Streptomyces tendae TaxID=1932 RepID=UPI0033AA3107